MSVLPRVLPASPSDHALIAAVANGNLEALGELFERHEPGVRRYLGRIGVGADDIDDLIQATFLEIVRAAGRFDPAYAARSWILGIAIIMVRRQRRSLARAAARIVTWTRLSLGERATTPDECWAGDQTLRVLARALASLAPAKRAAFVLVTLEGLSGEEAARALGIPVNTVWTRLHHARAELRAALAESEA